MFATTSMTGTGLVVFILSNLFMYWGIDFDTGELTEMVNKIILALGAIMTMYGQIRRKDLKWGLWRTN